MPIALQRYDIISAGRCTGVLRHRGGSDGYLARTPATGTIADRNHCAYRPFGTGVGHPAQAQSPGTPSSVNVSRGDGTLTASSPAVAGALHYHITHSKDGGAT